MIAIKKLCAPARGLLLGTALALTACDKTPEPPKASETAAPTQPGGARALPDFGGTEKVSTQATGQGTSLSAAIDDAIRNAIRQVNGQTVDASSESFQQGFALSAGDKTAQLSSAGFAQHVATHSRGAITDFKLISSNLLRDKRYEAVIEASVAKYKKPESANLTRVVIAPLRVRPSALIIGSQRVDPNSVASALRRSVGDALNQTHRFTVLDRDFSEDIDAELAFTESGNVSNEDFSRLGQALAADLIWVGTLEQFNYVRREQRLRTSDRVLVSYKGGAVLSYRLINLTTRQVVAGDQVEVLLPETEPTTLATAIEPDKIITYLTREISEQASQAVITKFFPITIVSLQGDDVILSQGGKAVQQGRQYQVYQLGNEIKDPQSGRSLGRTETACCVVEVGRVSADMAYGRIIAKTIELPATLTPGQLEVREEVMAVSKNTRTNETTAQPEKKRAAASVDKSAAEGVAPQAKEDKDW